MQPTEQANLQQLVDAYFGLEEVEFHCEACCGKAATIRHQLERLPRYVGGMQSWTVFCEGEGGRGRGITDCVL